MSRPRLSRKTAYLEVKILSLTKHENLTTGKKILWKNGEIARQEQFLLFSTIFSIYLKSPITYKFVKCGCSNYYFLTSANMICRGTNISKYFRESLGIRDNESRLYSQTSMARLSLRCLELVQDIGKFESLKVNHGARSESKWR